MSVNVLFSRIIFHGQSVKNWQVFSVLAIGASNLNMYHNKLFDIIKKSSPSFLSVS